jgi:transcription antitermination factor NusG
MHWYCAQTQYQQEMQIQSRLRAQGIESFLPAFLVRLRDYHISRRLLFNNYIFVRLSDPMQWPRVARTIGVSKVMTHAIDPDDPEAYRSASGVCDKAIGSLYDQARRKDEVRRGGPTITEGCFVKIIGGLWRGAEQTPLVLWSDGAKAKLLLAIFGREQEVIFFHKDLELVKEDRCRPGFA